MEELKDYILTSALIILALSAIGSCCMLSYGCQTISKDEIAETWINGCKAGYRHDKNCCDVSPLEAFKLCTQKCKDYYIQGNCDVIMNDINSD